MSPRVMFNMSSSSFNGHELSHFPVMKDEMLRYLAPKDGEKYMDCTFGAGGYSEAILSSCNCHVTALDIDPTIDKYVDSIRSRYKDRFEFFCSNFSDIRKIARLRKYNGVIFDLGISSTQLDNPERGLSFLHDGVLDMRMSLEGVSAKEFIAKASEIELANIIHQYGDESCARRIAKKIVQERQVAPIVTTIQLSNIVKTAVHRIGKIHPATKTFQAIRIHINQEIECLRKVLEQLKQVLLPGARIIVISFHSLEDRLVKNFFKLNSVVKVAKSKYSNDDYAQNEDKWLKIITKKPITPSFDEIAKNKRSRSAKMRVAELLNSGGGGICF